MFDQAQAISEAVDMSLEPTQNPNEYIITVSADSEWLNSPERVYPIIIDPTITTKNEAYPTGDNGNDTYIREGSTDFYYNNTYMSTGYVGVLMGATRSLLRFPLPQNLAPGAIVTDGALSLYKYTTTSQDEDLIAARINESWNSLNVTWGNQPAFERDGNVTKAAHIQVQGSHIGYINFDVWSIVRGWFNGGLDNNGFMVLHNSEANPLYFYYTSNNGSNTPLLSITYITDALGLNSYWSYANTSVGSVNTYNGNFLTSTLDYTLPGRGFPITLSRVLNTRDDRDTTINPGEPQIKRLFGKKWFSNLDTQLAFSSWGVTLGKSSNLHRKR